MIALFGSSAAADEPEEIAQSAVVDMKTRVEDVLVRSVVERLRVGKGKFYLCRLLTALGIAAVLRLL
jgi:hypothetical protein